MKRTRQAGGRSVVVLGTLAVVLAGCGEGVRPEVEVLGTSVTADPSTTAPSTTSTTADVDVRISATSVVRGRDDTTTTAPSASVRRPASAPAPTVAPEEDERSDGPDEDGRRSGTALAGADAVAAVRAAIAAGDLCAAYEALSHLTVSGNDARVLRRDMLVVVDLLDEARPLVPAELSASWVDLRDGSRDVADALDHDGASVSDAAAVYRDRRFRAAVELTDDWMDENCAA